MCNTPNFNRIVNKTIDIIFNSDYLKFWNIHTVFKNYDWYKRPIKWMFEERYKFCDEYVLSKLKLMKPVGFGNLVHEFCEYMMNNSDHDFFLYHEFLMICFWKRQAFTTVIRNRGYVLYPSYNKYLNQTGSLPVIDKPSYKYVKCKKYHDITIVFY